MKKTLKALALTLGGLVLTIGLVQVCGPGRGDGLPEWGMTQEVQQQVNC